MGAGPPAVSQVWRRWRKCPLEGARHLLQAGVVAEPVLARHPLVGGEGQAGAGDGELCVVLVEHRVHARQPGQAGVLHTRLSLRSQWPRV